MVGIFTGNGTGFERGSGSVLGGMGLLGSAAQGRGGEGVFVNAANGNLVLNRQDEFLVGLGPDVAIGRTYNSQATLSDDNNDKWRQSTDRRVFGLTGTLNTAGSTVRRVSADGSDIVYSWQGTAYVATDGAGAYDKIVKSGNQWIWTDGDTQNVEKYDDLNGGRIVWEGDTDGNAITYTYVGDKLDKATTADGAWTQYTWSGYDISKVVTGYTNLVTSVATTLTSTWYEYTSGRLTKVRTDLTPGDNTLPTDAQAYWTAYAYDGSGRVSSIAQKDGSSMAVTYDGSGRVLTLTQTASSGVTRITSLAYGAGYTSVTDATGQVTRLDYDAAGNLTKITAPAAYAGAAQQVTLFGYNANGDLVSTTDALGNATVFTFDGSGNVLTATDRLGATLGQVVTRTYGTRNELLTETRSASDASGAAVSVTTRYAYDGENHLRYVVSGEGNVTEYRYTTAGLLEYMVDYPEQSYAVGSGALTETVMNAWRDAIADRQSTKVSMNAYDARGNLTAARDYGYATTAGAGANTEGYVRTVYTYDQAGRLLSRNRENLVAETFVYDGMGRLTASTDVNGGTTSIVFNDTASTTTVTLASGYVTVNTYNLAGDLISRTDSGSYVAGGTATSQYDKLGRLRVSTDAVGLKRYYAYDKAGRLIAEANHYGDLTTYRYDADNQLVATARYATRLSAAQLAILANPDSVFDPSALAVLEHAYDMWSWTVYDKEGRTLATIGGDGSFQRFAYDKSGNLVAGYDSVVKLTPAQVAGFKTVPPVIGDIPAPGASTPTTRYFYDRDGRAIGTLDAEGFLTRSQYDKAGQKVADTAYFTAVASGIRLTGSFNDLVASAGTSALDRVTRYVYDGAGLLRYSVDALNQVASYGYDSAGLQTSVTRYAAAMAATADYSYDNVKALAAALAANPANRTSWSVRDTAGRVAYAIDADGGTTGYSYDNRGQVVRSVLYAAKYASATLPAFATMSSWSGNNAGGATDRITRYWYSARGEARYTVDAEGYASRTDFNAAGQAVAKYQWDNKIVVTNTTTIAQVETLSNASGTYAGHTYSYHANGKLYGDYDAYGVMTLYDYYATGMLAARYDAYGTADQAVTIYAYDGVGRKTTEIQAYGTPEQAVTTFAYDGMGDCVTMVDPRNSATSYTYDKLGQLKTITNAAAGVTSYDYDAFGAAWKITDARSFSTYSWYDRLGRVTHVRDAGDGLTQTGYTAFGEIASVTRWFNPVSGTAAMATPPSVTANAAEDAVTSFVYDKIGRVTSTTDAIGFYESYGYDAFGNRISVTAKSATATIGAGLITTYTFDRRGLLLTETLPVASYDSAGTQISTTIVNRYEYDVRGNRTRKVEADNLAAKRTTIYVYDKNDRLTETRGDAVSVIADDLVTATSVTPTERIKYDARGNIVETVDAGGARTLAYYDDLNRKTVEIVQTSATENRTSTFAYDGNGNVTLTRVYAGSVTLPATVTATPPAVPAGGYRETSYTYDALNRRTASQVSAVVSGTLATGYAAANLVTAFQYDATGNVVKQTDANGGVTWSWYDKLGQKTGQLDAEGYLTAWTYDPDGNVVSERRYDNRFTGTPSLTAAPALSTSALDRVAQYTYDRNGNRLSEARLAVEAWTINTATGALTAATGTATVSYLYNGLGQVVRRTEATLEQTNYAYDGAGRLATETRAAFTDFNGQSVTPTAQYLYDGLGNIARIVQSGATGAAARATTYSYGAGGRLASVTDASGFTRSFAYDAMGRVKKEFYTRATAAGGTVTDAVATRYDLAGRRVYQGTAAWNGASFTTLDYSQTQYNGYGDVWKLGSNGLFQNENLYDNAGRLTATTAGDGVWKLLGYDKNGNQSVAITSAGTSLAGQSFAGALAMVSQAGVNATYTSYDKRNLAVQVLEEGRQLTAAITDQVVTSRTYNAFGDVASETNALSATLNYTYNTIGRLIKWESPTVTITLENGTTQSIRPTENYYYDASGRMIGSRDANNNLSTRTLLAGTGYAGGGAGLVVSTFAPDTGKLTNAYDIHGDIRKITDQIGRVTTQTFDAMGRVIEVAHYGGLIEGYANDGLGRRIQAWNNQFQTPIYGPPEQIWVQDPPPYNPHYPIEYPIEGGEEYGHWEWYTPIIGYSAEKALTEYDAIGRVTSQRSFGGDVTTIGYAWNAGIAIAGLGTFGGWTRTTTYANTRTLVESADIFGRTTAKTDMGGHVWSFAYDISGRLTSVGTGGLATSYAYFNTGLLSSTAVGTPAPAVNTTWTRTVATYGYDKLGQKVSEATAEEAGYYSPGYWQDEYDPYYGWVTGSYWVDESYYTTSASVQNATATYDALGRLKTFTETGSTYSPAANIAYEYDANGNVRRTTATYRSLDAQGNASASPTTTDYWFRYDSMNRLVTDRGVLRSGQIVRGEGIYGSTAGQDIQYNAAGDRVAVIKTEYTPGGYDYYWGIYYPGNYYESRENYIYNPAGRIYEVQQSSGAAAYEVYNPATGTYTAPTTIPTAPTTGTVRSRFTYDLLGRQITQTDYEANGTTVAFSRSAAYNNKGQLTSDYTATKKTDGYTYQSSTIYDYGYGSAYALGSALTISTKNYRNNNDANAPDTLTNNTYVWWDGAVQASISYKPNTSQSTTYYTTFTYNGLGQLGSVFVGDARARTVSFHLNADGQIVRRDESDNNWSNGDPHEVWYRFNGRQLGYTGNNGTSNVSVAASIAEREQAGPTGTPGAFRGGLTYGSSYADFANSYDPINSYSQGSAGGGSYTVRSGDTLQSIAQAMWGDSSLWYKLAEANGLSGGASLVEGRTLVLPGGVIKSTYNASTLKPYNPAEAIGDVTPSTPAPQSPKKNKCGVFGMILLAVIAIAVTVVTAGAALAAIAPGVTGIASGISTILGTAVLGGTVVTGVSAGAIIAATAVGAMVGSIVSQGVGVATGIQEKFSWKAVALAGIGAAVTGGLGQAFGGGGVLGAAARGAAGSAITQGIGVATGLQDKFSWAGVAAAGVGAAAGYAAGKAFGAKPFGDHPGPGGTVIAGDTSVGNIFAHFGQSAVALVANAATRSAIEGSSFGDNVMAALPDVIAQTIGDILLSSLAQNQQPVAPTPALAQTAPGTGTAGAAATAPPPPLTLADKRRLLTAALPTARADIAAAATSTTIDAGQRADLLATSTLLDGGTVPIRFEASSPGSAGGASMVNGRGTIKIDPNAPGLFNADNTVNMTLFEAELVHEAQHIVDNIRYHLRNGPDTTDQERRTERNAYRTQAIFLQATGKTLYYKNMAGVSTSLTTATSDDIAEGSVKIWVNETIASRTATNAQIRINNRRGAADMVRYNRDVDAWNARNPTATQLQHGRFRPQQPYAVPAPYAPPPPPPPPAPVPAPPAATPPPATPPPTGP
ncbi:MAG: LysM peptidoglycan-binding domain-containing protein [Pseudomonadota bacterium]